LWFVVVSSGLDSLYGELWNWADGGLRMLWRVFERSRVQIPEKVYGRRWWW
jgi:hypothetical protein